MPSPGADPAYYGTPAVLGTGVRTITVSDGSAGSLQAAADAAQPGDSIVVVAGRYAFSSSFVIGRSGTPANWIDFKAAPGTTPVIDLQNSGEVAVAASYISFRGFEIVNGGGNNLHIAPYSTASAVSNVVVSNVKIHSLASGPGAAIKINRNGPAGVSSVYIENCDVSQAIGNAVIDGVGVHIAIVRDCYIHDNEPGSHGIFFKGGSSQILIERNLIRGIRSSAALQLGGDSGPGFFDPAHPDREGVDQTARNNLVADCDDSIFEVRGVDGGRIYHNTVVTRTGFAIFRLTRGLNDAGGTSDNDNIDMTNNLIISLAGSPQYARNDGNAGNFRFGRQLWAGSFLGSSSPAIPAFPQARDVVSATSGVVMHPSDVGLTGLDDAKQRYSLAPRSPARYAGEANTVAPRDILDALRSPGAPSIGAFE